MRFSLILATVDRVEEPRRFLASLDAQTHRDFELVVVDQNPDDRLVEVLEPYLPKFDVKHVRTEKRGLSRARNLGMRNSSGEVVGFPDDDCEYPPGLLGEVERFFEGNSGMDGLTGRLIDETGKTSHLKFDVIAGAVNSTNAWVRAIECTMFLRSSVARSEDFDEEIGVGAGTKWGASEGTDYLIRLVKGGAEIHYDPQINVIHPPYPTKFDAKAIRKAYSYGCGKGRVLRKNRSPLWLKVYYIFRPSTAVAYYALRGKFTVARWHWGALEGTLHGLTHKDPSDRGKSHREA